MGALSVAWLFLKRIPWQLWAVLAVVLMLWGLYAAGVHAGRAEVQVKFDKHLSADRGAEAIAKQRAKLKEEQDRAAFAVIGATFDQEKTHAAEKGNAVAAGIRTGAVRLRPQWTCPASDRAEVAGAAQVVDENADLRAASAGRIIAIGAEADAQVTGLQEPLRAERERPIQP